MNDARPLFPYGPLFTEAVRAYRKTDQCVRELDNARRALSRSGVADHFYHSVTLELRRRLAELAKMIVLLALIPLTTTAPREIPLQEAGQPSAPVCVQYCIDGVPQ